MKTRSILKKRGFIIAFKVFVFSLLILGSHHIAFASEDLSTVTIPRTLGGTEYTHYVKGCLNGSSSDCSLDSTYVLYFDDSAVTGQSGGYGASPPIGTVPVSDGYLLTSDQADVSYSVRISSEYRYICTDGTFTNCTDDGLTGSQNVIVKYDGSTNMTVGAEDVFQSDLPVKLFSTGLYIYEPDTGGTCDDGIQNGDETDIDSGGRCYTHIIDFTPENGDTISSGDPITFTLDAQIDPVDLGHVIGVSLYFHNVDQNRLVPIFDSNNFVLIDENVENSGPFTFSIIKYLPDGNYRVEAKLERTILFGFFNNPFSDINQTLNHQFIVGTATFIGTVSQNLFNETQDFFASTSPASATSEALARNCNPLGDFDIRLCATFLFVPDGKQLNDTMTNARQGVLLRVPWGYLTRFYDIISNPATVDISSVSATFPVSNSDTMTISFDPQDMLAGAGSLVDSITSPIDSGVTFKGTFEPMVKLVISLLVIFTIASDLMKSHNHSQEGETRKKKLS